MIAIRAEIDRVGRENGPETTNRSHTPSHAEDVTADAWPHAYTRETRRSPFATLRRRSTGAVGRIDSVYGDRKVFCSWEGGCGVAPPPVESYSDACSRPSRRESFRRWDEAVREQPAITAGTNSVAITAPVSTPAGQTMK